MTRRRKRRLSRRIRGGTLLALSTLMIGSAVLRIGVEAAPAISRELAAGDAAGPGAEAGAESGAHAARDGAAGMAALAAAPEDLRPLLAAFQEREASLERRERQIEDRMKALTVAEAAIEKRLAALVEAEAALKQTLALADGAAEDDLSKLTSVYEQMKPKDTAKLFEEMDPEFAAGFLARMRPEAAAGILAGMDPHAAYTISVVLAGRNATVPRE